VSDRRRIFLSAVTSELGEYRRAASDVLVRDGCEPIVQERFPTEHQAITELLKSLIGRCDAVICLVGFRFGYAPLTAAPGAARRSFTQLEYDMARELDKPTYVFLFTPEVVGNSDEGEEGRLQDAHRRALKATDRFYYEFANITELRRLVAGIPSPNPVEARQQLFPLRARTERLVGRDTAIERLEETWYDPSARVLSLVGWGGLGKTSLLAAWLTRLPSRAWLGAERVFVWSFQGHGDSETVGASDAFFERALRFFSDGAIDAAALPAGTRAHRLAALVGERRTLLILDGVDALLHPPGARGGELRDGELRLLLEMLATESRGLCIAATRYTLEDLRGWHAAGVVEWQLERLDANAAGELLRDIGVVGSDEDLRAAADELDAHPLALNLLGRYLVAVHQGDVRRRDRVQLSAADARLPGGQAAQVMRAYESWLERGDGANRLQLAVLRLLGLFDRPADEECLEALRREPPIPGLTDALTGASSDDWQLALSNLEQAHLLQRVTYHVKAVSGFDLAEADRARAGGELGAPRETRPPRTVGVLDAHALVREYFAERLRTENPIAFRAGHERLYLHLARSVPYWPEGLEGLAPLYQAVRHGSLGGHLTEACAAVYKDRIQRLGVEGGYSVGVLGATQSDLDAVLCFFVDPWTKPHPDLPEAGQAWVTRDAAVNLEHAGRLGEALEPARVAAQLSLAAGHWATAVSRANDVSRIELTLGLVEIAIASGQHAVELADNKGHPFWRCVNRCTLASALAAKGNFDEARAVFSAALELQRRYARSEPTSLQGFQYAAFLSAGLECAALVAYASRSEDGTESPGVRADASQLELFDEVFREVEQRAALIRDMGVRERRPADQMLGTLLYARLLLYGAVLADGPSREQFERAREQIDALCDHPPKASTQEGLVHGLLCRAWVRHCLDDHLGSRSDLEAASGIARRGPMELVATDVELYRACLFHDRSALDRARERAERFRYGRRQNELEQALRASTRWAVATVP